MSTQKPSITAYLDEETHEKLLQYKEDNGLTVSTAVDRLIRIALNLPITAGRAPDGAVRELTRQLEEISKRLERLEQGTIALADIKPPKSPPEGIADTTMRRHAKTAGIPWETYWADLQSKGWTKIGKGNTTRYAPPIQNSD